MAQRKLQIYLSDDQYNALKRKAVTGKSMAAVVRDMIEASNRLDDPSRDPFYAYVMAERPGSGRVYRAADAKRRLHATPKGPGA
jgi:hypothetical protein